MSAETESINNKSTQDLDCDASDSENEEVSVVEEKELEAVDTMPVRALPNVNVPEKIIICFDVCSENIESEEELSDDTSMDALISVLNFFLHTKQAINGKSEFSLVILKELEAEWVVDFTDKIDELVTYLKDYIQDPCKSKEFDISQLFDLVFQKDLCETVKPDFNIVPPMNFVRMILIYRRSICIPKLMDKKLFEDIFKEYPYFIFDVLYCHEKDCNEFKCEEIYAALQSLDNGFSYMFEAENSEKALREIGAKLLAHPLQRPVQKYASYII